MVCRCACVLLAEFRSRYQPASDRATAEVLYKTWGFEYSIEELNQKIQWMDKAGARYKYIEQFLGIGGFLVLGKDISETTYVFNFSVYC
jgi:hypothetical protein